uniref:Uncharacterized protein n=1 Tax=Cacopsylla melanoneura TaxID=428564 RepID=A0A8D8R8X3_9HEMI
MLESLLFDLVPLVLNRLAAVSLSALQNLQKRQVLLALAEHVSSIFCVRFLCFYLQSRLCLQVPCRLLNLHFLPNLQTVVPSSSYRLCVAPGVLCFHRGHYLLFLCQYSHDILHLRSR